MALQKTAIGTFGAAILGLSVLFFLNSSPMERWLSASMPWAVGQKRVLEFEAPRSETYFFLLTYPHTRVSAFATITGLHLRYQIWVDGVSQGVKENSELRAHSWSEMGSLLSIDAVQIPQGKKGRIEVEVLAVPKDISVPTSQIEVAPDPHAHKGRMMNRGIAIMGFTGLAAFSGLYLAYLAVRAFGRKKRAS